MKTKKKSFLLILTTHKKCHAAVRRFFSFIAEVNTPLIMILFCILNMCPFNLKKKTHLDLSESGTCASAVQFICAIYLNFFYSLFIVAVTGVATVWSVKITTEKLADPTVDANVCKRIYENNCSYWTLKARGSQSIIRQMIEKLLTSLKTVPRKRQKWNVKNKKKFEHTILLVQLTRPRGRPTKLIHLVRVFPNRPFVLPILHKRLSLSHTQTFQNLNTNESTLVIMIVSSDPLHINLFYHMFTAQICKTKCNTMHISVRCVYAYTVADRQTDIQAHTPEVAIMRNAFKCNLNRCNRDHVHGPHSCMALCDVKRK